MRKSFEAVFLMGASSVVILGLTAVRTKVVALELGTSGVGFLGIVMATIGSLATLFGLGLGVSAIGALASTLEDGRRHAAVHRALRYGVPALAALSAVTLFVAWLLWGKEMRGVSALFLAPWLAMSLAVTVAASRYTAILSGLGRVRLLATVNVVSSVVATLVVLVAAMVSAPYVLVAAVAAPAVTLYATSAAMVHAYCRERHIASAAPWRPELRHMVKLGVVVSSSALMLSLSQLFVTWWVTRTLGLHSTGLFQAGWAIANLYLTFMLGALTAEYLPRLSKIARQTQAVATAATEQMHLMTLLAVPIICWLILCSPLLLSILYTSEFTAAAPLLRMQLLGDVFKVIGWTLAFILLARQAKLRFFAGELVWNATFVSLAILLARHGLAYVGVAYTVAYVAYLALTIVQTGYRFSAGTLRLVVGSVTVLGAMFALVSWDAASRLGVPIVLAAVTTIASALLLARTGNLRLLRGRQPSHYRDTWSD